MKNIKTIVLAIFAGTVSAQVGIGTSTPSVPLDIEATDAAIDINNTSSDPLIHFQLSGTTNFTIGTDLTDSKFKIGTTALETGTAVTVQSTGEVGIGTTSPTAKFEVDGSAIFNESGAAVDFRVEGNGNAAMLFVDADVNRVGIGTNSPDYQLTVLGGAHINSGSTTTATIIEGGTDANLFYVHAANDRVGIGTSSPSASLDVEGTFILQNGTSINELSIDGTMAGNSDDAVPTEQAVVEYVAAEQQVLTKTIIIEAPTNTDYFPVFRTDVAITIQEALGMLNAAGDVDVRLYWDSDFAETSPTAIGTTTQLTSTSATTVNISSDATIPADRWVFVDIPEATTAQTVTVNIRYTED